MGLFTSLIATYVCICSTHTHMDKTKKEKLPVYLQRFEFRPIYICERSTTYSIQIHSLYFPVTFAEALNLLNHDRYDTLYYFLLYTRYYFRTALSSQPGPFIAKEHSNFHKHLADLGIYI